MARLLAQVLERSADSRGGARISLHLPVIVVATRRRS